MKSEFGKIPLGQIFIGLTGTIRDHYIFVFLFSYFIFRPSLLNLSLLFIGLIFNHLLINTVHQYREMIIASLMVEGKLKPLVESKNTWNIQKIPMRSFTSTEIYDEMIEVPIFKIQGKHLEERINIYKVNLGKNNDINQEIAINSNIVCFARPFNDSFIFVDVNPTNMKALSKFKVLHEIGHALLSPFFIESRRQGGFLTFLGFVYILYCTIDFHSIPIFFIIIYILIGLLRFAYNVFHWFHKEYIDELFADFFALSFLSSKDSNEILEKVKNLSAITRNPNLFNHYVKRRTETLRHALDLTRNERWDDFFDYMSNVAKPKYLIIKRLIIIIVYSSFAIWTTKYIHSLNFIIWPTLLLLMFYLYVFFSNKAHGNKIKNALDYLSTNQISI
jgi:hypothetical protein